MRTTLGNIKQLLHESQSKDLDVIHPESFLPVVRAATARLRLWIDEEQSTIRELNQFWPSWKSFKIKPFGRFQTIVVRVSIADVVLFSGIISLNGSAKINVWKLPNNQNPEFSKWLKKQVPVLTDLLSAQPSKTGLWWADENYYPIRPMYEGEDGKLKPEPDLTIVNGFTGDVVEE